MDGSFPRKRHCDGYSSGPQSAQHQLPCIAWRDCRSIHGLAPVAQECVLKGCYVCADLSRINDEISSTYQRLSDLVKEREQIMEKPRHDTLIYRMPVEILSSIFFFVEEAILSEYRYEEHPDHGAPEPAYQQLCQSPPLLVGAVCKRWRDITLETPQLWNNITVDLEKPTDGQLDMVKKWACRSGVLPLDITVFPGEEHDEFAPLDQYENLISALRSLVLRWKDVALYVPAFIFHALLKNLPEAPHIGSMFFPAGYYNLEPISMQHPLYPRRLISKQIHEKIPFGWDRLVFLEVENAYSDEIIYVIRHAPNLRHCIARGESSAGGFFPMPTSPITNSSLTYLETSCDIFGHLTLPSLLHLNYDADWVLHHGLESLVGFLDRSCAPLPNFILRCYVRGRNQFPSFEGLAGITHLSLVDESPNSSEIDNFFHALIQSSPSTILPRVKILEIELRHLLASSWSLFSQLFPKDSQTNPAGIEVPPDSITIKRSLSRVSIDITGTKKVTMDKDTFLRLLEVKKSGVNLSLYHDARGDLFRHMAQVYDIEL